MTNFDTVREALNLGWHLAAGPSSDLFTQALTALTQIEADHFTSADMASAAAQGHRDGVASVQQGEPVAWLYESPMPDGSVFVGASADRLKIGIGVTPDSKEYPLYRAAPVAQQPQAERVAWVVDTGRGYNDVGYSSQAINKLPHGTLLYPAPQQAEAVPPGFVLVPVDVLTAASESLGSFVSDHGWTDLDMQAMDNLDAILAQQKGGV